MALALIMTTAACGDESSREEASSAKGEDAAVTDLREALRDSTLESLTDEFVAASLPSVVMRPDPKNPADEIGVSRIGGRPDLPRGSKWPHSQYAPLTLVAQIDLAEVTALVPDTGLPADGLLSFFVDHESDFEGLYPETPDMWRVIHSPAGSDLVTLPWPEKRDPDAHFAPVGLTFDRQLTFPSPFSVVYDQITAGVEDSDDAYWNAVVSDDDTYRSQIGGHHEPVQGDVTDELADASAEAGATKSAPADWRLLLQFASLDDLDMSWDDEGVLYFGLTAADLANQKWDKAWFVRQSH